ncbi:MAG: hypothetical protein AB7O21_13785 [Gammaproteobacteria bacterium]
MKSQIRYDIRRLACAFALILVSGAAAGAPVSIVNASFETPVLGDGGFTLSSITGWSYSGSVAHGVFNPTPSGLVSPPDGAQVAFLDGGGTPVSLTQTLSAVLAAGESYVLEADFAYRINCCLTPTFTLALLAGGSPVASVTGGPGDGFSNVAFKTATVNFTAPMVGPELGTALGIRISMVAATNEQIVFDNVRLNANPVPLPASGLVLMPALGWLARRRLSARVA